jgi:hypothetical protein
MAKSLEEAQEKFRAADKELLAAKTAFDECPWRDRDKRIKTWKRLEAAEASYHAAVMEFAPWVNETQGPSIRVID